MSFAKGASRLAGLTAWLLGWGPGMFWDATPAEVLAILAARDGPGSGDAPPDRATLDKLKERFPDG